VVCITEFSWSVEFLHSIFITETSMWHKAHLSLCILLETTTVIVYTKVLSELSFSRNILVRTVLLGFSFRSNTFVSTWFYVKGLICISLRRWWLLTLIWACAHIPYLERTWCDKSLAITDTTARFGVVSW
jgi:hypothetical protein